MNKPLFSISTPCWNAVSTIERTIKSILEQEYNNYEYIIVDGGSTDGTIDIIKKYEPLFQGRMRWTSERDKGLYDAFNKGIEKSTGTYCWNVNADDFLAPGALKKLADFIESNNWDTFPIISGGMNFVSQTGRIISTTIPTGRNLCHAYKNDYIGVPHPSTLVPKATYDRHGKYDIYYKIIGDADWFHRVYAAGEKFVFIDYIITNMTDGGISNLFVYKRSLRDRIYYLNKFYFNPITKLIHWAKWTLNFYIQKYLRNKKKDE